MALHTDKNGNLHDDMGGVALQFFPVELGPYTQVTDEEAAAIRIAQQPQPDPVLTITSQIEAMEREQLMPRATREFMLLFMETNFTPELLAVNPGYQAVKAFDNQIVALRGQLS